MVVKVRYINPTKLSLLWPSGNRVWTTKDYSSDNSSDSTKRSWISRCSALGFRVLSGSLKFTVTDLIASGAVCRLRLQPDSSKLTSSFRNTSLEMRMRAKRPESIGLCSNLADLVRLLSVDYGHLEASQSKFRSLTTTKRGLMTSRLEETVAPVFYHRQAATLDIEWSRSLEGRGSVGSRVRRTEEDKDSTLLLRFHSVGI